jgi:orotidine-5'-phosphate decarboxylase
MSERNFLALVGAQWAAGKHVCVGLDSELKKVLEIEDFANSHAAADTEAALSSFNEDIVDMTKDLVCCYKPNLAFYEAHGAEGIRALRTTIDYIHEVAPGVPVIADAKRADIGNTNNGYAEFVFDYLGADAVTVNPYFGKEAMQPFLDRKDKGIIVLCRTSNKGAGEFQDLKIGAHDVPLYVRVAQNVTEGWNEHGNCALVVGATYPAELAKVREVAPEIPLLIPGIGKQGGDLEQTVKAAKHRFIINSSSGIIFAGKGKDFAEAACAATTHLHMQIRDILRDIPQ